MRVCWEAYSNGKFMPSCAMNALVVLNCILLVTLSIVVMNFMTITNLEAKKNERNEQLTKVRCLYWDILEIILATEINAFPFLYSFSSIWQKCIFCLLCARHFPGHWWQTDGQHIPEYFHFWIKTVSPGFAQAFSFL